MTEFELNNIKDRVAELIGKVDSLWPNNTTILGKHEIHISILKDGVGKIQTMLEHGGYDYSVVVAHLSSLETYYTLINKARLAYNHE